MNIVAFDEGPLTEILNAAGPPPREAQFELGRATWGFGGVHGGLALAMLVRAMQAKAPGQSLRRVSGQFRRPLRGPFAIETHEDHAGNSVRWLSGQIAQGATSCVAATAIFATPGAAHARPLAAEMPAAPSPSACPIFTVPPEFVPFATRTEIRPIGDPRPFARGGRAELSAWVRLREDDRPPDDARTVVLLDALAPSYAAILDTPVPIPTVTLSVTWSGADGRRGETVATARSPWILLRAQTELASDDGWLHERIDAWTAEGAHLATADQLRVVRQAR
jgi:hypothetical protein